MAAKAMSDMTDKQLEDAWTKASKDLQKAKDLCREFSQEAQIREATRRAEGVLDSMTDTERDVLIQTMVADGVLPKAALGKPGDN